MAEEELLKAVYEDRVGIERKEIEVLRERVRELEGRLKQIALRYDIGEYDDGAQALLDKE